MAYTEDDLNKVKKALTNPAEEIQMGDKKVKLRSQADLIILEEKIKSELGMDEERPFQSYPSFDKGF